MYRFDLIFLILDPQDEIFDRRLANHLVSLYHQGKEESEDEHLVRMLITLREANSCISSAWNRFKFLREFNTQLPCVIAERASHHIIVMDGRSFGQSQWNFLLPS